MKQWLGRVFLLIGIVVSVAGLGMIFQWKINQVVCRLETQPCSPEFTTSLQELTRLSFWVSDVEAQVDQIMKHYPEFEVVEIRRLLPATVEIDVKPRQPLYQLTASNQELGVVNQDGAVIIVPQALSLPVIRISDQLWQTVVATNTIDQKIHLPLTQLLQACQTEKIACQRLELINQDTVVIELPESRIGILSLEFPERDLKKLSLVLNGLEPDKLKDVQEIDVRYRLPVLRLTRTVPRHDSQ